ncbi:uncharacterized protein LOC113466379 [Diaphorina citri]|uniref:Uncharacterized protein LOC113466379 n=1 Tax=Diaphorina citri TaxID=121845 RepID=A0A3Q0IMR4_DIACI|nr:uncharacterized protein LOC113466379 [Diaphorina citri]
MDFLRVQSCCQLKCYDIIDVDKQKSFFLNFSELKTKNDKDNFILRCMEAHVPKQVNTTYKRKTQALYSWKYYWTRQDEKLQVCMTFLLSVLQIGRKRIRTIQGKFSKGQSIMHDQRGKHTNRPRTISDEVWQLVQVHWASIPHTESHYSSAKSSKKYFVNPELNVKKVYKLFQKYYESVNGRQLSNLKYRTYCRYFQNKSDYAFRQPRTDVCDFCTECKIKLKMDPNDSCKTLFELHLRRFQKYKEMKAQILSPSGFEDNLVLEFDFAQNLALPKLNVNRQYYSRQLSLYVFNVHVHNNGESFLFYFMEHEARKNSDAVCSMLYETISRQLLPSHKQIVLLSDAAGGQNKNGTMVQFCSYIANSLKVKISHLFPVRGHSYNICDRNFGLYGKILKKKQRVSTISDYVRIFKRSRQNPCPFVIINAANGILRKWSTALAQFCHKSPVNKNTKFTIQQFVQLKYDTHGNVLASKSFSPNLIPFKVLLFGNTMNKTFDLHLMDGKPITKDKEKDLKDLMKFLLPSKAKWFDHHVFSSNLKITDHLSDTEDDSETEY